MWSSNVDCQADFPTFGPSAKSETIQTSQGSVAGRRHRLQAQVSGRRAGSQYAAVVALDSTRGLFNPFFSVLLDLALL